MRENKRICCQQIFSKRNANAKGNSLGSRKLQQKEIWNIDSKGRTTETVTIWVNIIDYSFSLEFFKIDLAKSNVITSSGIFDVCKCNMCVC